MSTDGTTASREVEAYVRRRQRLSLGLAAIVVAFFLPLPILGGFTPLLDTVVFEGLTVAWLYAFAQFIVALAIARFYLARADRLERHEPSATPADEER